MIVQMIEPCLDALDAGVPLDVAVLIPCYNEEASIADVVAGFRQSLPAARIYVCDNNSSDRTVEIARGAGAIVHTERLQGKGNVVRRMFNDIEADVYVLVDGDNTYEAAAAPRLIEALVGRSLDMVTGKRVTEIEAAYRPGHRFGNALLTNLVVMFFGRATTDMLSGYRVFSKRFVKSFPALSDGFQIETELTVHALELRMPVAEIDTVYLDRPAGSESKLNTWRDGIRILRMITKLIKDERPFQFFGAIAAICAMLSVALAVPVIGEYLRTGLVRRFPTAGLSAAIMLVATLSFFAGLILDTVSQGRREMKRLFYLQQAGVSGRTGAREAAKR
jgi:glycosyltransferase involved in cell wall biosynthesis